MEEKKQNEIREKKYKRLNIFFYFNENQDILVEIKKLISTMTDKFLIKGEFNQACLLNELSYYLGIEDKIRGKIKKKEMQNLIITFSSFDNSKNLLFNFINKFKEGIVKNDDHPFFIFLKDENDLNFNFKQLMKEVNKFQEKIKNTRKLDSRNVFLETKETILEKIENIFNYYNENDEKNIDFNSYTNYNKSYTINILTIGRRGAGKSTLINRLLGEKKAYAQKNAKTLNTKEYYHRYYPLKFIDSAGFEIGTLNQIKNVTDFLKQNNLNYENIFKKIHFIFYLFKSNDKFEDIELQIIKELSSFNIDIFFIITNMTFEDDEDSSKSFFEDILKEKHFTEGEINKIIGNTFCLDLLDINHSNIISNLLLNLYKKIEKYQKSNDFIIECINNFNSKKRKEINQTPSGETERLLNEKNPKEGILVTIAPSSPNDLCEIIKEAIKDNIFFIDFESDRKKKYGLALKIVDSYRKSAIWWGSIPIPILDYYLPKLSRERMIKEIGDIYEDVIKKRIKEKTNKNYKEEYNIFRVLMLGGPIYNQTLTFSIGREIVDEFDKDYAKIDIIDKYLNLDNTLNQNFNVLKEFYELFEKHCWYDINIYQNNKSSKN